MPGKDIHRHGDYQYAKPDWEFLDHAIRGERAIKEQGHEYLPPTPGMIRYDQDGTSGAKGFRNNLYQRVETRYEAFKRRAEFPEKIAPACAMATGLFIEKTANYSVPADWESTREFATPEADTIEDLHRIVSQHVCGKGRVGIWCDIRDKTGAPYWVVYSAEEITDWEMGVVGDEKVLKYLQLETNAKTTEGEPAVQLEQIWLRPDGVYVERWQREKNKTQESDWISIPTPQPRTARSDVGTGALPNEKGAIGGFRLPRIPFQFINADGLKPKIGVAPFLALAKQCRRIYQLSASYYEALALGEPTFVVEGMTEAWLRGGNEPKTTGLGVIWYLPVGSKGYVLEPNGPMIPEQRTAIETSMKRADELALRPFEPTTAMVESGDAKRERRKTQTSAAKLIAQNVGSGMQAAFRMSGVWLNVPAEQITFEPSYDFVDAAMDADTASKLWMIQQAGGLAKRSFHNLLLQGGLTEHDFETEIELIGKGE